MKKRRIAIIGVLSIILMLLIFTDDTTVRNIGNQDAVREQIPPMSGTVTRSFRMGYSSWPPDATVYAVNAVYDIVSKDADIIFLHFDQGVPWQEAFDADPLPDAVTGDIRWKKAKLKEETVVYLGVTPLNFERSGLAAYWSNSGTNQQISGIWSQVSLNDDRVKRAYLGYVEYLIESFDPEYLSIGSEVNMLASRDPLKWKEYVDLQAYVYKELKKKHRDLPIFATLQYQWLRGDDEMARGRTDEQLAAAEEILAYSDLVALTIYKYGTDHDIDLDEAYFDLAVSLAGGKKAIALAEVGALSKNTKVLEKVLPASEEDQSNFLSFLLKEADMKDFLFVINYFSVDFEKLLSKTDKDDGGIASAWAFMGLYDSNYRPKPAHDIWSTYFSKQFSPL